ncbi:MoaD/ThiS family protein [Nocardia abscessus]|uniref:MoaD/ThiS family protein n=1 Tax=Nocardia TaxID=1817 RepID=UPI0018940A53|nr:MULTISPECIES: MoaD/ThiS family protein [Nocardia]MBF6222494.1 MoaD/ThiS family protein [Nocardia abscessus]
MVEVRYFASIAEAVGKDRELIDLPAGSTLADLRKLLCDLYGEKLDKLLAVCAYIVGDELTRDLETSVTPRVDVLPPFAGG